MTDIILSLAWSQQAMIINIIYIILALHFSYGLLYVIQGLVHILGSYTTLLLFLFTVDCMLDWWWVRVHHYY